MLIDLDAAVAAYWSGMRVGVTDDEIVTAWSAAAGAIWKDELYVEPRDGITHASFLFNSGHVRTSVCACALLVAPMSRPTTHFLTVVLESSYGLNLGWALHTRTLDATWGDGWWNPAFGQEAIRSWKFSG